MEPATKQSENFSSRLIDKREVKISGLAGSLGLAGLILTGGWGLIGGAILGTALGASSFPKGEKPWRGIADLLAEGEHGKLEYKEKIYENGGSKISPKIGQVVTSFANAKGGEIILGVTDNSEVVGIDDEIRMAGNRDRLTLQIQNHFNDSLSANIRHLYRVKFEKLEDGTILRVEVLPSKNEVFCKGQFYMRHGPQTKAYSNQEFHEYQKNREE